jgi:hypothetical protein
MGSATLRKASRILLFLYRESGYPHGLHPLRRLRPAVVLIYDLVDLIHQGDGFAQCDDDFEWVKSSFVSVRPLRSLSHSLADLVAADMKVPHVGLSRKWHVS